MAIEIPTILEDMWRTRLEQQMGRMVTESEWQLAKAEILKFVKNDVEMGTFDGGH